MLQLDESQYAPFMRDERFISFKGKPLACEGLRYTAWQWLQDCLFLDTETTGLGVNDEIVEISIINHKKQVLFNSLIKPVNPIPDEAIAIHGITNEMVANAPTWAEVHEEVSRIVQSAPLVIFNAEFDMQMMAQTAALYGLPPITADKGLHCALWLYAAYFGEWKAEDGRYRRQSLQKALEHENIVIDVPAHRALGDTLRTHALIESMADCGSVD